jgi:dCTP deaminase
MAFEQYSNCCLPSQGIRELIRRGSLVTTFQNLTLRDKNEDASKKKGWFIDEDLEDLVQPASFDPMIGDVVFELETDKGLSRPDHHETVSRALSRLPGRSRRKYDISSGFELKRGSSYLIPLVDRVKLEPGQFVRSSPKSSLGRLFLNTRLLADYNSSFNEINAHYAGDRELAMWLLVQPLAFNVIAHPGLKLNQLRFFQGHDAQLRPSEIVEELKNNSLLNSRDINGLLSPYKPVITDSMKIRLNLSGEYTEGIVGLRARNNAAPIDLKHTGVCDVESYFEPIEGNGSIVVKPKEYYLLSSADILQIPSHINIELRSNSDLGFSGPLHFAGFIDPGFQGDLVFEVRPDEVSEMVLTDNMPVSILDVYRTPVPDKLYGVEIGSNYQEQIGPRPSKYFGNFDFTHAARRYRKLDKLVLVQEADLLRSLRVTEEGFELITEKNIDRLKQLLESGFFHSRYDCEDDNLVLQPIPYVLVFGPDNTIFSYVRAQNIQDFGDARLFGKHSIGLGGHILKKDAPDYIVNCMRREVFDEEVDVIGECSEPSLVGTMMAYNKRVDQVHFGLIMGLRVQGDVRLKESSIISGGLVPIQEVMGGDQSKYETWSKKLIPHLDEIGWMV